MLVEKKIYKNVDNEIMANIRIFIKTWCQDKSYNSFEIIVVLYELYNNSAKHSKKNITIILKFYERSIVIRVNDDGEGFNVKDKLNVNSNDLKKNIHKSCGRGIYIVKNFVSQIYYNKKGNQVIVKINEN